jgi:hypothetical protein
MINEIIFQKCRRCGIDHNMQESIFCSVECALDYVLSKDEHAV